VFFDVLEERATHTMDHGLRLTCTDVTQ
jgi:hypothetical protein